MPSDQRSTRSPTMVASSLSPLASAQDCSPREAKSASTSAAITVPTSTWLRDYLYKPLGGSRQGRLNTYRNLMITMLLGGIWHGAAWKFVAWGGLHGIGLVIERSLRPWSDAWASKYLGRAVLTDMAS